MSANPFTIMPRVLSHFGDELIRSEVIALTELAKNSYDANAETCTVTFYFDETAPSNLKPWKIVIQDDGDGMTKDDIINYWLTVGTDNKKQMLSSNTKPKRIPLGEKGIGRLGVHKLGERITVTTKTINSSPIAFIIDWTKLDGAKSFKEFEVNLESGGVDFDKEKGLTYEIENIKGQWTLQKLRTIYRALTALNVEFFIEDCSFTDSSGALCEEVSGLLGFVEKKNTSDRFTVNVKTDGNNSIFANLESFKEIKDSASYECDILLRGNKVINYQYAFYPIGNIKNKFDHRVVSVDNIPARDLTLQCKYDPEELPVCSCEDELSATDDSIDSENLHPEHYIIDLEEEKIGDIYVKIFAFEKTPGIKKAARIGRTVDTYLKENSGIRVYRDGMRVYDYGEKGYDWLGLSSTADIGNQLRNEHIIGYVFLDRKSSSDLVEKTNREGFIENHAFSLFRSALQWALTQIFRQHRNYDKTRLSEYYTKTSEPVITLLTEAQAYVDSHIENEEHRFALKDHLFKIEKEYKDIVDMLYQSAGLGILSASIVHEIEKLIDEIKLQVDNEQSEKTQMLVRRLGSTIKKFTFLVKKTDIKRHSLEYIYENALTFAELRLINHKIAIDVSGDISIECSASINHATNVLLNIIDNSIYWINSAREKQKAIKVFITDKHMQNYASIIIADNGPGFVNEPGYLIKPFVSTKPYSIGSGLGLYIADELMRGMDGSLSFPTYEDVSEYFNDSNLRSGAIVALNFKKTW